MAMQSQALTSTLPKLQVQRGSETFELAAGQDLKPGDIIRNISDQPARVGAVSRVPELSSQLATLQPGAAIRVTERGEPTDEVLGLEAVDGRAEIGDVSNELAGDSEYVITPEVTEVAGLFGAAPLLGGLAGPAAGALGLAALLSGGNSDDGDAGAGTNNGGGGLLPDGSVADNLRNGVSGLLDSVNNGLNDTPAAPATQLTDAIADGTNTAANQLAMIAQNDPTGMAQILAGSLGFTQPGTDNGSSGVSGGVDALSAGLTDATAGTPLAGIAEPLTGVLGGNAIEIGGLASSLADIGSALPTGNTPLGGLSDTLLAPVVGTSEAASVFPGTPAVPVDPFGDLLGTLTGAATPLSSGAGAGAITDPLANLAPV